MPTATEIICPTEHEPNDTFEQASPIMVDDAVQSYICPGEDVDVFRFLLEPGQQVSVHLYEMSYNADLELYDPAEALMAHSNNEGTAAEELALTAEQEGWYFARVFGTEEGLVNPYVLLVASTSPPPTRTSTPTATLMPTDTPVYPGCPDVHEPNDECGADKPSWNVTTSSTQSYICAATDVDFWRIPSVAISETIDIALNPGNRDYRLQLYDPQCQSVKSSLDAYKGTVRMRHTAAVAGMWYVKVFSAQGFSTTEPYTITGSVDACMRDRLEDNDDVRLRTPLDRPLTAHVEEGLTICPAGEQDWFGVRLEEGDNLLATLTHNSSIGPLQMCLYDPVLANILQCTDPFSPGRNRIDYLSPVYGTHYLVVDGAAPGVINHNYSISVEVRVPPTPTPTLTPFCPYGDGVGNSFYSATSILTSIPAAGIRHTYSDYICPMYDEDWFKFTMPAGQTTTVTITLTNLPANYWLELWDPNNLMRTYNHTNGTGDKTITWTTDPSLAPPSGDSSSWRVLVYGGPFGSGRDYHPTRSYNLEVSIAGAVDLSIQEIEVTQAIQDLDNSIPLVRGKIARARVYVGVTPPATHLSDLEVWLYAYSGSQGGSALPGSPLKMGPADYPVSGAAVAQKRPSLASSFNFLIPSSWQSYDTLYLKAEVNPNKRVPETNYGNNVLTDSTKWHTCSTVNLKLVQVASGGITVSLNSPLVSDALSYFKDVYPINQLNVSTLASGAIDATRSYTMPGSGGSCSAQWSALVDDMQDIYDNWSNRPSNAFVYGFLDATVPHCNQATCNLGCGSVSGTAAAGILDAGAGETLAHEVGHNLGRRHAPCGVPDPDPNWPSATNPNGSIGEVGVRWSNFTAFGTTTPDFMSYCSPPWVSPYTYTGLQAKLCTASASSVESAQTLSPSPHLVASGRVSDGELELRPFWVLDEPQGNYDYAGEGPYSLELQDASGTVLFARRFDPTGGNQGLGHTVDRFHEIVPFVPEVQRIVFRHGDTVLRVVELSLHHPQVTVLSPNGGEVWGAAGTQTITWQAEDEDGDPLVAHVLYSFDGGESWEPLAVNVHGNQCVVQGGALPGSDQVLVQVRVSDGVNVGTDQSDATFRVSRKPPTAFLLQPQDGTTVRPGTSVVFSGLATDPEDGPVPVESLTWTSDLDGALGTGGDVVVDTLSNGKHRITLMATDSDGNVAEDAIWLLVGNQIHLPILVKF